MEFKALCEPRCHQSQFWRTVSQLIGPGRSGTVERGMIGDYEYVFYGYCWPSVYRITYNRASDTFQSQVDPLVNFDEDHSLIYFYDASIKMRCIRWASVLLGVAPIHPTRARTIEYISTCVSMGGLLQDDAFRSEAFTWRFRYMGQFYEVVTKYDHERNEPSFFLKKEGESSGVLFNWKNSQI